MFSSSIGIDLGTANTLVYVRGGDCDKRAFGGGDKSENWPMVAIGNEAKECSAELPATSAPSGSD